MNAEQPQPEDFVSEAIIPAAGTFDPSAMSRGEPGLPRSFTWRDNSYEIARLVSRWKSTGTDRGETYLRRHWFSIETTAGQRMTIYCERQAKPGRSPKARWWLYSMGRPE